MDLDSLVVVLDAIEVLDDFLRSSPDREMYSKTEVMNLALDMRAVLSKGSL